MTHKHDARIEELANSISNLKGQLAALEDESRPLRNERAADLCEFKRGDRVIVSGKEYEVRRVIAGSFNSPEIYVWSILKNGKPGSRESKLYSFQQITRKHPSKAEGEETK